MIWGFIIDYAECPLEERLNLIDVFLPCIDNWAICDNFCCNSAWLLATALAKDEGRARESFRARNISAI